MHTQKEKDEVKGECSNGLRRWRRFWSPMRSKNDMSQAIMLYGSISPMSKVLVGMKRVGLKRFSKEMEEG